MYFYNFSIFSVFRTVYTETKPLLRGEIILYTADDGSTTVRLRAEEGTVWLAQAEIAALFQTTPQNITLHVKTIYEEGELEAISTCKECLQVRTEGEREIHRNLKFYNLSM